MRWILENPISGPGRSVILAGLCALGLPAPGSEAATLFVEPLGASQQTVQVLRPPGDTDRTIWVSRLGKVRVYSETNGPDTIRTTLNLTRGGVASGGFLVRGVGLLSMAFDPDFQTNGHYYVLYTNAADDIKVTRYTVTDTSIRPNGSRFMTDETSGVDIITIPFPDAEFTNDNAGHVGGWIGFGEDGTLFITTGDRNVPAPNDRPQSPQSLYGKVLRIDPLDMPDASAVNNYSIPADNPFADGSDGVLDEIYLSGLRNPYRAAVVPGTNDLVIGDVGDRLFEEINIALAEGSSLDFIGGPGSNFGWPVREGPLENDLSFLLDPDTEFTDPFHTFGEDRGEEGGASVTGGVVYEGEIAALQDQYFFADFASGEVFSFDITDLDGPPEVTEWDIVSNGEKITLDRITTIGTGVSGTLHIGEIVGQVYRVTGVSLTSSIPVPGSLAGLITGLACLTLIVGRRRRMAG